MVCAAVSQTSHVTVTVSHSQLSLRVGSSNGGAARRVGPPAWPAVRGRQAIRPIHSQVIDMHFRAKIVLECLQECRGQAELLQLALSHARPNILPGKAIVTVLGTKVIEEVPRRVSLIDRVVSIQCLRRRQEQQVS